MNIIDGYLSRLAQDIWPEALVKQTDTGAWILERPDVKISALERISVKLSKQSMP